MYLYFTLIALVAGTNLLITGIPFFLRGYKTSLFNRISGALFIIGALGDLTFDFSGWGLAIFYIIAFILLVVGTINSANDRIR